MDAEQALLPQEVPSLGCLSGVMETGQEPIGKAGSGPGEEVVTRRHCTGLNVCSRVKLLLQPSPGPSMPALRNLGNWENPATRKTIFNSLSFLAFVYMFLCSCNYSCE